MQKTHPPQPTALTPTDPLGARFCRYFNHPWKHIYAPVPEPGEKPQWLASKYFLTPRNLWQRYLDPDTLIGLRFGDETRYCLLDIDKGSCNHPANNESGFKDVLNALEEIGLVRPLVVTSSLSSGLHVYYFFDRPLPTFALACAIKFALLDADQRLQSGHLESFPNTKAWRANYNACRLPLQVGSCLLDDDLQPLTSDLAHFLDAADVASASQDLTTLQASCTAAKERYVPRRMSDKLKGDVAEWKRDWEKTIAEGWTAPGQTNELLKVMVAYGTVFEYLSGEDLIDYVVNTAINAQGYQEFCGHQHEIRLRAQEWASSTERNEFYSAYCSWPNRRGTYKETFGDNAVNNVVSFKSRVNEQRNAEAHDRIRRSVAHLKAMTQLPKAVTARAKAIIAAAKELIGTGISMLTLRKKSHLPLWHPRFDHPETAVESKSDNTDLDGGDVALSSNPVSTAYLQQHCIQRPSLLISDSGRRATSSSLDHAAPITSSKQVLIQDEIPASTAPSKPSTEIQIEVREELPKPLPELESPIWITPPLVVQENDTELKSPEVPSLLDSSDLDHTPPLMKVIPELSGMAPPQKGGPCPAPIPEEGGESEGGNEPVAAVEPEEAAEPAINIADLRRITALRLKAKKYAEQSVRGQSFELGRLIRGTERSHLEQIAKFRFYWESGESALMAEAISWASTNPDALPEALPPQNAASPSEVLPPAVVGDRVWWDDCPGHCSWMNPFTITAIDGDMAWLDFYSGLVPLSKLRHV